MLEDITNKVDIVFKLLSSFINIEKIKYTKLSINSRLILASIVLVSLNSLYNYYVTMTQRADDIFELDAGLNINQSVASENNVLKDMSEFIKENNYQILLVGLIFYFIFINKIRSQKLNSADQFQKVKTIGNFEFKKE